MVVILGFSQRCQRVQCCHISLICITEVSVGCLCTWAAGRGLWGSGRHYECHCWRASHHQAGSRQHWRLHETLKPLLHHWRCRTESEVRLSIFWVYKFFFYSVGVIFQLESLRNINSFIIIVSDMLWWSLYLHTDSCSPMSHISHST